jgi:hypothetical protein
MWEIDIDECRVKVMFCREQTFATLDTTVRKVVNKNLPFLLSDTVDLSGIANATSRFIQKYAR